MRHASQAISGTGPSAREPGSLVTIGIDASDATWQGAGLAVFFLQVLQQATEETAQASRMMQIKGGFGKGPDDGDQGWRLTARVVRDSRLRCSVFGKKKQNNKYIYIYTYRAHASPPTPFFAKAVAVCGFKRLSMGHHSIGYAQDSLAKNLQNLIF